MKLSPSTASAHTHSPEIKAIKKMVTLVKQILRDDSTLLDSYTRERLHEIADVGTAAIARAEGR